MVAKTITCVGVLLVWGCGASQTSGPSKKLAEDDDPVDVGCLQEQGSDAKEAVEAASVLESESIRGCMGDSNTDNGDSFRIDVPADLPGWGLLEVMVEPPQEMQVCVALFDSTKAQMTRKCADAAGESISSWVAVAPEKPFYVQVTAARHLTETMSYGLSYKLTPIEDPDEPNDWHDYATEIPLGEPHSAYFVSRSGGGPAENDFYIFQLDNTVDLNISVTGAPAEVQFSVELFTENQRSFKRFVADGKGLDLSGSMKLGAGIYYAKVANALGGIVPHKAGFGDQPSYLSEQYTIEISAPKAKGKKKGKRKKRR